MLGRVVAATGLFASSIIHAADLHACPPPVRQPQGDRRAAHTHTHMHTHVHTHTLTRTHAHTHTHRHTHIHTHTQPHSVNEPE